MSYKLERIWDTPLLVGECPTWDDKNGRLLFVDIRGKAYYSMDYSTGKTVKTDVPQAIGCLAMCEDGDLLLSMEDGIYRENAETKELTLAHQPLKIKGERFNDGKIGPDGCYYVGTAGENFSGAFYLLEDGKLTELFDRCGCSNGIDWTSDGKTMFYVDSREQKLEKFAFRGEMHALSERKTVCEIPLSLGSGDGMTIDENGDLWIAVWGGNCVWHVEGKTGKLLDNIEVPAKQVSSCCFAGEDLSDLIITTAAIRTDPKADPEAGKIFRIRPGVKGVKFNRYIY